MNKLVALRAIVTGLGLIDHPLQELRNSVKMNQHDIMRGCQLNGHFIAKYMGVIKNVVNFWFLGHCNYTTNLVLYNGAPSTSNRRTQLVLVLPEGD